MAPTHCPWCKHPVPPGAKDCPNCPMSFPEEADREAEAAPYKPQWSPLPWVLVAAAVGLGVWVWRSVTGASRQDAAVTAPAKPAEPLRQAPPEAEPDIQLYMVSHETARPVPRARKPEPTATEWRLRGRVFDLATLAPLAGVTLTLSDPATDARLETVSDASGRYRAIVPPLARRGYNVLLRREGYAGAHLDPGLQDVAALPEPARRALCAKLAAAVPAPAKLRPKGAAPLVTDFYLAPK